MPVLVTRFSKSRKRAMRCSVCPFKAVSDEAGPPWRRGLGGARNAAHPPYSLPGRRCGFSLLSTTRLPLPPPEPTHEPEQDHDRDEHLPVLPPHRVRHVRAELL